MMRSSKLKRETSMFPLIAELSRLLPVTEQNAYRQKVLVPGCGLGRLPVEIAAKGYCCQGNEFSAYMAVASNFLLNGIYEPDSFTIHPWLDRVCNVAKIDDIMEGVKIPDIAAIDVLSAGPYWSQQPTTTSTTRGGASSDNRSNDDEHNSRDGDKDGDRDGEEKPSFNFPRFSMAAGDFVDLYGRGENAEYHANSWDAVVTCFVVDTAPVVLDYVDVIYRMLRPGGVWINLGPLLYHWVSDLEGNDDDRYDQSIELSWEELEHVIKGFGFDIEKQAWQECTYTHNTRSMMWNTYRAKLFTAIKRPQEDPSNIS